MYFNSIKVVLTAKLPWVILSVLIAAEWKVQLIWYSWFSSGPVACHNFIVYCSRIYCSISFIFHNNDFFSWPLCSSSPSTVSPFFGGITRIIFTVYLKRSSMQTQADTQPADISFRVYREHVPKLGKTCNLYDKFYSCKKFRFNLHKSKTAWTIIDTNLLNVGIGDGKLISK